uniref:Uncharacterized protein n=1 Tax=Arundo donax TaxID=35708 RepID=A0A0A9A8H6_ARUDO
MPARPSPPRCPGGGPGAPGRAPSSVSARCTRSPTPSRTRPIRCSDAGRHRTA